MQDDPAVMNPSQRRLEIATILAKGILRLRQCHTDSPHSCPSPNAEKAPESRRDCLDDVAKTSPHGVVG